MALRGIDPAVLRLLNALGVDTKQEVYRVVIDIKVDDVVRLYTQRFVSHPQIEEAAKIVEVTHLESNSDFAECVIVDAISIDEKGNVATG